MAAIEITGDGRVYLDADDGRRWRVHDVAFGPPECPPHQRRVFRPPSARANYRHFVAADGTHRSYRFPPDETRVLDAAHVQRQLDAAGYPATKPHDPNWLGDPR